MNLTLDLKRLSETKMISRRDLKCYVDSWIGPLSGEAKDAPDKPCAYAFAAAESGLIKIGSTCHPIRRLYQLRYTITSRYAPDDAIKGRYVHLEPLDSAAHARAAERLAHRMLERWRVAAFGATRRNRNEWYDIDPTVAARGVMLAAFFAENPEHFSNAEDYHELLSKL